MADQMGAEKPDLTQALADLRAAFGDRVTTAQSQREHHSSGESHHAPAMPDVVCFPLSTEEVSTILKISSRYNIPVIPFGAGTSVEGQISAIQGGLTVDLREMKKVLRISPEDRDVTVTGWRHTAAACESPEEHRIDVLCRSGR